MRVSVPERADSEWNRQDQHGRPDRSFRPGRAGRSVRSSSTRFSSPLSGLRGQSGKAMGRKWLSRSTEDAQTTVATTVTEVTSAGPELTVPISNIWTMFTWLLEVTVWE
jgi:hypothetical protein